MPSSLRRGALALAAVAACAATAPAAQAASRTQTDAAVCNQASPHWLGGGLVALDPPVDSPAARYTTDIGPLPGKGAGLAGAAAHSPALTLCGPAGDGTPPSGGPGGGIDVGGGAAT